MAFGVNVKNFIYFMIMVAFIIGAHSAANFFGMYPAPTATDITLKAREWVCTAHKEMQAVEIVKSEVITHNYMRCDRYERKV